MNLFIFFSLFFLLFSIRVPVSFSMICASLVYMIITPGPLTPVYVIPMQILSNMENQFTIIAIPLFIFMANIMNTGRVTDIIFKFANVLVGHKKGGLAHVNVVASLIFSGMTGSAIADASGLGVLEIAEMKKAGYSDGFSCAVTAASATIGPIFPPSMPMIFYSLISGASIGALFMGGVIPGALMAIMLMIYVAYISKKRNYPTSKKIFLRDKIIVFIKSFPALFTIVIILGGIYSGVVTTIEAGAVGSLYALIISFVFYKSLSKEELIKCLIETVKMTASISLIICSAFAFSYILASEGIPKLFANFVLNFTTNSFVLLAAINIIFLLLGMFLDVNTILVVFLPIVIPLIKMLGIDLVHFGVLIIVNIMIGMSTPPYGILLFITSEIAETPIHKIIKEIYPMVIVMIIELLLITYIPQLVLFIPSHL